MNNTLNSFLNRHQKPLLLLAIFIVIILIAIVIYNWYLLLQMTFVRNKAIEQRTEDILEEQDNYAEENVIKVEENESVSLEREQEILEELSRDNIRTEYDSEKKATIRNELAASSSSSKPPMTAEKKQNILDALNN